MSVQPVVQKRGYETREGKGFSRDELKEVGIDFKTALRLHVPIDKRRETKHEENVKTLKRLLQKRG